MSRFIWPIRIYYEDTDAGGVVFYANYLKFFERARTEWLRLKGYEQDALRTTANVIFAVRSVQIDYLSPARFNEQIEVSAELTELKKASLVFNQAISRGDTLLCQGVVKIACINSETMRPTAIPESLFEHLKNEY